MVQNFEIMMVFDYHNSSQFFFARQINTGSNFVMKEGSYLGGVPIFQYLDIPRILDDNQQPRLDVFVFRLLERLPVDFFKEGQLVELVIPD